ncbi:MAG: hypothetical protein MUF64_15375 [Polyangiaceae bacterium]|jgi:hypothetical protein|nr:hypothetical protein [Polyangiaceae bacterium]
MREPIVSFLAFAGLAALGITVAVRPRSPHQPPAAPAPSATASSPASSAPAAGPSAPPPAAISAVPSASAASSAPPAASSAGAPAEAPALDRPLQVAVLGWELAVPLVVANQGLDPSPRSEFSKAGVGVKLGVSDRLSAIENALARGGADRDGADIALLSLPSFVAAYERLRALNPEIFFVVGWSRGRDALMADKEWLTADLKGPVALAGDDATPSLFLGLWSLGLAGFAPPQLKLLPSSKASEAQASAQDRSSPFEGPHRMALLSTADASRLIPYVAVAQRSLLERHGPSLVSWARGWLTGQKLVEADPAAAARSVGSTQGAPGPLPLLKGMGEIQPSSLADGVRAAGLSGRNAITLEGLFQQSWQVWKQAGVVTSPAPDAAPIAPGVLAALVRSEGMPPAPGGPTRLGSDKGKPLLVVRHKDEPDERALEAQIGLLAGAFERSAVRVARRDERKLKKLLESAQGTYDIAPGRLLPATKAPEKGSVLIEVFPAP